MPEKKNKATLLLSGGQDSFVCLLWAFERFSSIDAISISYGQSHEIELKYASRIAQIFNIPHFIYPLGNFFDAIADSSLLNQGFHSQNHPVASHLPASFVPNRNGIFLTIAANHAFRQNPDIIELITGTCETDYSGYPDCRDSYIKAKSVELSLGLDKPVNIHTPLMWKSKAQTFEMAQQFGKLNELIEYTLTCYNGVETINQWGRGCGNCPSCVLRINGWNEFQNQ